MKKLALLLALVSANYSGFSQRLIEHEKIDETFYSVTGQTYNTLSEITITITEPGKVVLTMAGIVDSTVGDDIILAVSDDEYWSNGLGQVVVQALSNVDDHSTFSHMMVYELAPGTHTFYALAGRTAGSIGNGTIDLDATFVCEFTADSAEGNLDYAEVSSFLIYDSDGFLNLHDYAFTPDQDGQLKVKFSGHASIPFGEEFELVSNSFEINAENVDEVYWANYSQIITPSSAEANKHSFTCSRTFEVDANEPFAIYTYVMNSNDLFSLGTVNGTLTYEFIPNITTRVEMTGSHSHLGFFLDEPDQPNQLWYKTFNCLTNSTVVVEWSGRLYNDEIGKTRLWITTNPDNFSDYSTEDVLVESSVIDPGQEFSFYHIQDVSPGERTYYIFAQNSNTPAGQWTFFKNNLDIKLVSEVELGECDNPLYSLYVDNPEGPVIVESCESLSGTVTLNEECVDQMIDDYSICEDYPFYSICLNSYNDCLEDRGCTYPSAVNYDPDAMVDDGSCICEGFCPSDINGDGFVTTTDLSIFLGAFGSECTD